MTAHSQLHEPGVPRRRGRAVRKLLRRISGDGGRPHQCADLDPHQMHRKRRPRMAKRKVALAISAGVMGLSGEAAAAPLTLAAGSPAPNQMSGPGTRLHASALRSSERFKRALVQEEGVRNTVYRDVAGFPTVGVGHLVTPADGLQVGDSVSYDRVLSFLEGDLREAEGAVVRLVGDLPLFQHEFDALVDLVYNVGEGNLAPGKSPRLNRAVATHDYAAMAAELEYRFAAGQMAMGLVYRSERRTRMFRQASYDDTRPPLGGMSPQKGLLQRASDLRVAPG